MAKSCDENAFQNIIWNGEEMHVTSNVSIFPNVFYPFKDRSNHFNPFPNKPLFLHVFSTSIYEHTVEKREIAQNEQFLLLLQFFLPFRSTFYHFHQIQKLLSANSFSLEESKICQLGQG